MAAPGICVLGLTPGGQSWPAALFVQSIRTALIADPYVSPRGPEVGPRDTGAPGISVGLRHHQRPCAPVDGLDPDLIVWRLDRACSFPGCVGLAQLISKACAAPD